MMESVQLQSLVSSEKLPDTAEVRNRGSDERSIDARLKNSGESSPAKAPAETEVAEDRVTLSQEASAEGERPRSSGSGSRESNAEDASPDGKHGEDVEEAGENARGLAKDELSEEERAEVKELAADDRKVRAHEQAHIAAGGQYVTSGAHFELERGPDGKMYAVAGEVGIDASEVKDDPEATIAKMQQVRRAALAPADPSSQDRAVAAKASRKEVKARKELMQQGTGETQDVRAGGGTSAADRSTLYGKSLVAQRGVVGAGGRSTGSLVDLLA